MSKPTDLEITMAVFVLRTCTESVEGKQLYGAVADWLEDQLENKERIRYAEATDFWRRTSSCTGAK